MSSPTLADKPDFHNLNYEDFKRLARNPNLSSYEKVGFPDTYRQGQETAILGDIIHKIPRLNEENLLILDIGCGCSPLTVLIDNFCIQHQHQLYLNDSLEMLEQLPVSVFGKKVAGKFPNQLAGFCAGLQNSIDVIIAYSVIQYVYAENGHKQFIDEATKLLKPGGVFLIGDIPNREMRNRFFSSEIGKNFHRQFTNSQTDPIIEPIAEHEIKDDFILEVLRSCRQQGLNSFVLPQTPHLPMGNRREDILIHKL